MRLSGVVRLWLLLLAAVAVAVEPADASFQLVVLHTNDLHSRFAAITSRGAQCGKGTKKCFGGVARIKSVADRVKAENPGRVIFVNGGDFFQGTVWYSMFKWRIVANLTTPIGYTASSLGNHEFDDGVEDLVHFLDATAHAFPTVACNLELSAEPELAQRLKCSVVETMSNNWKVGIVGYLTPDTKQLASTGRVVFKDEVESIRKEVERLRQRGVNIVIAVGHSGYEMDKRIAREVPGVDIVVGGHTNTFLWSSGKLTDHEEVSGNYPTVVTQPSTGEKVLVVQTSGYGKYLGRLTVTFDSWGKLQNFSGLPILLDQSHPEDSALASRVALYAEEVAAKMDVIVGESSEFIDGSRPKCRLEECSFGNLVTDAMAKQLGVKIAVINSGAIKGSFQKGDIRMRDVLTAMPWANTIDVVTIPGRTLREVLEHSVSAYDRSHPDPGGTFLQLSGLVATYDVSRPSGQRVLDVQLSEDDSPLQDSVEYDVAVLSFMVKGGDGYEMIPDSLIEHRNTGALDNDIIVEYIRDHQPLRAPEEGRIIFSSSSSGQRSSTMQTFNIAFVALISQAVLPH